MRRVSLGSPASPNDLQWIMDALRKIELHSRLNDLQDTAAAFSITGLTESRTADWSTATTAEKLDLLATFIVDAGRGGQKRV